MVNDRCPGWTCLRWKIGLYVATLIPFLLDRVVAFYFQVRTQWPSNHLQGRFRSISYWTKPFIDKMRRLRWKIQYSLVHSVPAHFIGRGPIHHSEILLQRKNMFCINSHLWTAIFSRLRTVFAKGYQGCREASLLNKTDLPNSKHNGIYRQDIMLTIRVPYAV